MVWSLGVSFSWGFDSWSQTIAYEMSEKCHHPNAPNHNALSTWPFREWLGSISFFLYVFKTHSQAHAARGCSLKMWTTSRWPLWHRIYFLWHQTCNISELCENLITTGWKTAALFSLKCICRPPVVCQNGVCPRCHRWRLNQDHYLIRKLKKIISSKGGTAYQMANLMKRIRICEPINSLECKNARLKTIKTKTDKVQIGWHVCPPYLMFFFLRFGCSSAVAASLALGPDRHHPH